MTFKCYKADRSTNKMLASMSKACVSLCRAIATTTLGGRGTSPIASLLVKAAIAVLLLVGAGTAAAQAKPTLRIHFPDRSIFAGRANEDVGTVEFVISIDTAPTAELVVPVTVVDFRGLAGTLAISGRFVADNPPTSVTLAANTTAVTLSVAIEDDDRYEVSSQVRATISNPDASKYQLHAGHPSSPGQTGHFAFYQVSDDTDPIPEPRIQGVASAVEGEPLRFVLSLTRAFDGFGSHMNVRGVVRYSTRDGATGDSTSLAVTEYGTAEAPDDYTAIASGAVTFLPRQTTMIVTVTTKSDSVVEGSEALSLILTGTDVINLTKPTNPDGDEVDPAFTGVIHDGPVMVNVNPPLDALEGEHLRFLVTLNAGGSESEVISTSTITVAYSTQAVRGASAFGASKDYEPVDGTLTFLPGQNTKAVLVSTVLDTVEDPGEGVELMLQDVMPTSVAELGRATAIGTITEPKRVLSVAWQNAVSSLPIPGIPVGNSFTEDHAGGAAIFVISVDRAQVTALEVPVTVNEGGGDFFASDPPTVVLIPPNTTTATVRLVLDNDRVDEVDAIVFVTLTNPDATAYTLPFSSITASFTDDDVPEVSLGPAPLASEGAALRFVVQMDIVSTRASITVEYETQDGTATTADMDYTGASGILTFLPGEIRKTVEVAVLEDTEADDDETVTMVLSNVSSDATLGTSTVDGTIVAPTLSVIAGNAGTISERDGMVVFVISNTQDVTAALVVPVAVSESGKVLMGTPPTTVTIQANERDATLTLALDDDDRYEPDSTITVTISNPDANTYKLDANNTSAVVMIEDDEPGQPEINIQDNDMDDRDAPRVVGGEGGRMIFVVSLTHPSEQTITVMFATQDGTATEANMDYTGVSGTLTFLPGETRKPVTVAVLDDTVDDSGETITLALSSEDNASVGRRSLMGTLVELPVLAITTSITSAISEGVDGTAVTFIVTLTGVETPARTEPLSVPVTVEETGNVILRGSAPNSVTLPVGGASATLVIRLHDDFRDEMDSIITVTLGNPDVDKYVVDAGAEVVMVTVTDDDDAPMVLVDAAQAREGSALMFLVSLTEASERTVLVSYATTDGGTATPGDDYEAVSGQLTFGPNDTELTVAVMTLLDDVRDPDETVHLALSAPMNASLDLQAGTHTAIGTIIEGLNEDAVRQLNEAILPYVAASIGEATNRAVHSRVSSAFSGNNPGGFAVRGASLDQFLVSQAKRSDATLFNRGQGQALGVLPNAAGAMPHTSLEQWQAQADARSSASQSIPRLGITDLDFTMALSGRGADAAGEGEVNLWGRGYYSELSNDADLVSYDGSITGGTIGIDLLRPGLLVGLALNRATADVEWGYDSLTGVHETTMQGFHPYVAKQWDKGGQFWVSLGYEQGDTEITESGTSVICDDCQFDVVMRSLSFGVSRPFYETDAAGGNAEVNFIGDLAYSHLQAETREPITAESGWVRIGVEMDYQRPLADNNQLEGGFELAWRSDFGDARSGNGLELGANLDLRMPELGLRFDIDFRTLLTHSDDIDQWGISGGVSWIWQPDGKGLSLAFKPQWGVVHSAREALWEHGLANDFRPQEVEQGSGRYRLELRYGLPVLQGQEVLSLFTRSDFKTNGQDLSLGADFNLGRHFSSGYEMLMRSDAADAGLTRDAEHRGFIRYERSF